MNVSVLAASVYILCALASTLCALLLLTRYFQNRARLLFWAGLFFACFAVSNILLVFDWVIFPDVNLTPYRTFATFTGISLLLYGMIWETS